MSLKTLNAEIKKIEKDILLYKGQDDKIWAAIDLAERLVRELRDERDSIPDVGELEYELDILEQAKSEPHRLIRDGKLTVYKKARYRDEGGYSESCIVTLEIPAKAQRSQDICNDFKCRASEAKVLKIEAPPGNVLNKKTKAYSTKDNNFFYTVGKTVKPRKPFDTSGQACASGIHFFMTREDAENY